MTFSPAKMAHLFGDIAGYEWRRVIRTWRRNRGAKLLTLLCFLLLGAVVLSVLYTQSVFFLRLLTLDATLQQVLSIYLFEFFTLILFFLMLFSSLIHAVYSYVFRKRDAWIVVSPRFRLIPWYYCYREFLYALWPLLIIGVPFLLAVQQVFDIGVVPLVITLVTLLLLVWVGVMLMHIFFFLTGILVQAGLRFFSKSMSVRLLLVSLSVLFLLASAGVWQAVIPRDFVAYLGDIKQQELSQSIEPITSHFHWSPSHLAALAMYHSSQHADVMPVLFQLLLWAGICTLLFAYLLRHFLPFWQSLQEGHFVANTGKMQTRFDHHKRPSSLWNWLSPLTARELIVFGRNARNLVWLGFIASLALIQLLVNTRIEDTMARYALRVENLTLTELTMQLVILLLFVTALVLRFVLPSFSLEHKYSWIMASYPTPLFHILKAKFKVYWGAITTLSMITVTANIFIFRMEASVALLYILVTLVAVFFLTAVALGLGVMYPNYQIEDASELSTSVPGLTLTFSALFYGILLVMACRDALMYHAYGTLAGVLSLTVLILLLLWWRLQRKIAVHSFETGD